MNRRSQALGTSSAKGLHGCEFKCGRMPLGYMGSVLLAVLVWMSGVKVANAELILYISDGASSLTISDGDALYDTDLDADAIAVDISQLESAFSGWDFGAFFRAFSNFSDVDGRPAQVLNLEFLATNNTGSSATLEVVTSFIGSNGRIEPTTLEMNGGASTNQAVDLGYTFVGTYSQDTGDDLFTNGFAPGDTATRWTFTAAPQFTDNPNVPGTEDLVLNLGAVTPKDVDGVKNYALTYGVRVTNLESGKYFGSQSELDYILPEPASIATWAVAVGLVGLAGKRKRKVRTL